MTRGRTRQAVRTALRAGLAACLGLPSLTGAVPIGGTDAASSAPLSIRLRADRGKVTQAQARTMTAADLAAALLAPDHPAIVERVMLPDGMVPTPPPPYVPPLDVRLLGATVLDAPSGFCLKRRWRITGTTEGMARDVVAEPTLYRISSRTTGCGGPHDAFFSIAPDERPRAFTIVKLLAGAVRRAPQVGFPLTIDDEEGRKTARYCDQHPGACDYPHEILTDAPEALARLPIQRIAAIGRRGLVGADLLPAAALVDEGGHARENWMMFVDDWIVHIALDGDRITAMALRRRIPPPF